MDRLASALQSILGTPVVDETGIRGSYNLELAWGDDGVASLTAVLEDRFGLRLSPAKREMEALIVDRIRPDAALVLLAHIGDMTRGAPAQLREGVARIPAVH